MVGAGSCFILVFTHRRHLINLFRKSRYLNKNQESVSRAIASSYIPSITCEYVPIVKATLEYPSASLINFGLAFSAGSGFRLWSSGSENAEGQKAKEVV